MTPFADLPAAVSSESKPRWLTLSVEERRRMWGAPARPAERKPRPAPIRIELTSTGLAMGRDEEEIKVSGWPDGEVALRLLKDQVRRWAADDGQKASLCIRYAQSVEYATLKAVLDACREAGVRKIEVQTAEKAAGDQHGGASAAFRSPA